MKKGFKKFFSRTRFQAMLFGFDVGLYFLVITIIVGYDTFLGSLLLNLSATALAIPLIASILDYWLEENKRTEAAKARGLAKGRLKNTISGIKQQLALLYGYDFTSKEKIDPKEYKTLLDIIEREISDYIRSLDLKKAKINAAWVDIFFEKLHSAEKELSETLSFYSFALDAETKGVVLELRQWLVTTVDSKELTSKIIKTEDFMHSCCPWILENVQAVEASKIMKG